MFKLVYAVFKRPHNLIRQFLQPAHICQYTEYPYSLQPTSSSEKEMNLQEVVCRLKKFAPLSLAESWDNVGLLIEPSAPHKVNKILLTNDLTLPVLNEAIEVKADLILSYHPPLFTKFKRLLQSDWKQRVAIKCVENRIAVYSPHTCYDVLHNGVNDWLISPFKGSTAPIHGMKSTNVEYIIQAKFKSDKLHHIDDLQQQKLITVVNSEASEDVILYRTHCSQQSLTGVTTILQQHCVSDSLEVIKQEPLLSTSEGSGRLVTLDTPITVQQAVDEVKQHLKLTHVRLATAVKDTLVSQIKSIAVCAGSGSSVLNGVGADLYLTGEMSHHEVLHCTHSGHNVILCDHSNTERGFLTDVLQGKLHELLGNGVNITVSKTDRDPLQVV